MLIFSPKIYLISYPSHEKLTTVVTIFEGGNCETNIDDCDPDPCLNSGQCDDLTNDHR